MAEQPQLNRPWLIAVWPGMGNVAITAGYYLMAKLQMHELAEFSAEELFEVDHVEVKGGLIQMGSLPRSRFFLWRDPDRRRDIVVFLGEAQPPMGKHAFCRRLIRYARGLGVERIFTFAAMASDMHPQSDSRVFGAATDGDGLAELQRLELELLEDGQISGLNGVLVGVAAEAGLRGTCLLGEMPQIFVQLPFPKASLAVLETFAAIAGMDIDFSELAEQSRAMEQRLTELLDRVQQTMQQQMQSPEETLQAETPEPEGPSDEDRQRIEQLFRRAREDRSKAYELKRELDRLGVFKQYEDRFLDLFKKQE